MNLARRLACLAVLGLLPAVASAQQSVKFRLAAQPGNIQGCIAADPQFTREHTLTVAGGEAELTSPGGVNTKLKATKPNVFETDYAQGRLHLHLVADLAASPPTLTVTEKNLGCKWMAVRS
ncbi:hypothetical protein [Reyranella sp.]|uniref:hypothetical protein n=1 Tax=Reyranella sp. TaxID=1929291 RepID=UPI003BAAA3F2